MLGQQKEAADTKCHESSQRRERSEEVPPYQDINDISLAARASQANEPHPWLRRRTSQMSQTTWISGSG